MPIHRRLTIIYFIYRALGADSQETVKFVTSSVTTLTGLCCVFQEREGGEMVDGWNPRIPVTMKVISWKDSCGSFFFFFFHFKMHRLRSYVYLLGEYNGES